MADRTDRGLRVAVLPLTDAQLDRAYRLAGLILGDAYEAEDATQEALVRAWKAAGSVRSPGAFPAWFDRILVNVCRDHLRRRKRRIRPIPLDGQSELALEADPFQAVLDRDEALSAMRDLSDDQRIVLVLHYWADLTLDDIGKRLGWPTGTVRSRLHQALGRMRSGPAGPSGR